MSVTGSASEVAQAPETPVRPPCVIDDVHQLNRRHQHPLIITSSALLDSLVQARYVIRAHLLVEDSGRHLDQDDAGDSLSVHVQTTTQPDGSLDLLDKHPAQATLPRIIAYALVRDSCLADTLQEVFTLRRAESTGRNLDKDIGHG